MLISPIKAIEQGWIRFPSWMSETDRQKCIQPNAIDITGDKYSLIRHGSQPALITETSKSFHVLDDMSPVNGTYTLKIHSTYDVHSDFYVEIPSGVCAELIIRSTLNRMGLALNAGLWDSGYKGHIGAVVHNRVGDVVVGEHTRICQIKFYASDSVGTYSGGYNTNIGEHWKANK